ncbi:MAG TPA: YggS family pyridoxal phosphate-dependent enzyme [Streptosporangiaceae bacterium]
MNDGTAARRAEISDRLDTVRKRIAAACQSAGREPGEVTLVAVTKTFPASDVRLLAGLGVHHVGENKDQEAAPKAAECADLADVLTWHFIGQLQTNKAASVVGYAGYVHSVDRPHLVQALGRRAAMAGRVVTCLVQVSLDDAPGRGGAAQADVPALAESIAAQESLLLGGIMAIAPLDVPAAEAFAALPRLSAAVRQIRPAATMISAGMTGDLEEAIAAGATHVRVGTALLGGRPSFVG